MSVTNTYWILMWLFRTNYFKYIRISSMEVKMFINLMISFLKLQHICFCRTRILGNIEKEIKLKAIRTYRELNFYSIIHIYGFPKLSYSNMPQKKQIILYWFASSKNFLIIFSILRSIEFDYDNVTQYQQFIIFQ